MSEDEGARPSKIDPKFRYEVARMPGGKSILQCFQCGTCTSDCPVARFNEKYRPRYIIRMAQLGLRERVLNSDFLWLCASCFTCTDRCPQGVEVASVIRTLKNMAAMEGRIPQVFKDILGTLLKTGYIYEIPESRIKRRETESLPPLPKANIESLARTFGSMNIKAFLEGEDPSKKIREVKLWA
ncbi:MAG: 4Fe-4S dicluster domain-containing protein [Candidatus Bathyarchaeia archaeon]